MKIVDFAVTAARGILSTLGLANVGLLTFQGKATSAGEILERFKI